MRIPAWATGGFNQNIGYMCGTFTTELGDVFQNLELDKRMIMEEKPCLDWKIVYKLKKSKKGNYPEPMEFMYGYAITCHAAQGSTWDKVLVIEEGFPYKKDEHQRWLYTACTRPSSKLVLVR